MTAPIVALLGTGKMGAALVDRWHEAGREVVVWNRTASSAEALRRDGVRVAATAADAAREADIVVVSLTDGTALCAVLIAQGTVAAMRPDAVLVDLSTVDVPASAEVALEAQRHGIPYLRGAVSGSPGVMRSGAASLLLSGPQAAYDAARPVLDELTTTQVLVGDAEQARVVKLAVNSMLGATMQILAEAVTLAEASGVTRERFLDAVDASVMHSRFVAYKGAALRARDYTATFTTADMRKDVLLALGQASSVGVIMPVADLVLDRLDAACASGFAASDFLALQCVEQQASGRVADLEQEA